MEALQPGIRATVFRKYLRALCPLREERLMPYPIIDTDECIGCGACVDVCVTGAIEIDDGFCTVVDESECKGCGECQADETDAAHEASPGSGRWSDGR